jgi:spore germination protein KA/spore germination protein
MMGVVEAVRMMMIRIPTQIGATIALFSGLALVIAGLFSNVITPVVLIVVTLAIVSSFGIPNFDLRSAIRLIQFFTMIMATELWYFWLCRCKCIQALTSGPSTLFRLSSYCLSLHF